MIRLSSNQVIAGKMVASLPNYNFLNLFKNTLSRPPGNAKFTRPVTCHGPVFAKTVNGLILEMKVNNIVRDDGRGRIRGLVTFR